MRLVGQTYLSGSGLVQSCPRSTGHGRKESEVPVVWQHRVVGRSGRGHMTHSSAGSCTTAKASSALRTLNSFGICSFAMPLRAPVFSHECIGCCRVCHLMLERLILEQRSVAEMRGTCIFSFDRVHTNQGHKNVNQKPTDTHLLRPSFPRTSRSLDLTKRRSVSRSSRLLKAAVRLSDLSDFLIVSHQVLSRQE